MNKCMTHENCIPPEQNPKGNLRSIYYHSPINSKPIECRIIGYKICDCCHKIIRLSQEELN